MKFCECGNPSSDPTGRHSTTCTRCRFLDGRFPRQHELIGIMRQTGRQMTFNEIMFQTTQARNSIARSLKILVSDGRVKRYEQGTENSYVCYFSLVSP